MSNIKIKNSNGQWVETTKAINTKLMDLEGNFESKNVEVMQHSSFKFKKLTFLFMTMKKE